MDKEDLASTILNLADSEAALILNDEEVQTLWNWLKNEYLPANTDVIKLMAKISVAAYRIEKK